MWMCQFPNYPKCAKINVKIKSKYGVSAIRIWNYNKSSIDTTKGVKDLEIFLNEAPRWYGTIDRGSGNETNEYCTTVYLDNIIKLPEL